MYDLFKDEFIKPVWVRKRFLVVVSEIVISSLVNILFRTHNIDLSGGDAISDQEPYSQEPIQNIVRRLQSPQLDEEHSFTRRQLFQFSSN